MRAIIESLDEGLIAYAPDGTTFANAAFLDLYGCELAEDGVSVGQLLARAAEQYQLTDEDGRELPPSERPMARVLRGETLLPTSADVCYATGERRKVSYKGRPIFNEDGSVRYAVVAVRDVTTQTELMAELERLRERSAQLARVTALQSLTLAVAHELNQPLTTAISHLAAAQIMLKDQPDDRASRSIESAIDSIVRGSRIIRRFRDRLEQRQVEVAPKQCSHILNDAITLIGTERSSVVRMHSSLLDNDYVRVDEVLIQQVFINLIRNAIEATERIESPKVDVRLSIANPGYLLVEVIDNGPGVSKQVRERLFEPFNSFSKSEAGLGVGLSICHSIVEQHDGRIWLSDDEHQTRFCLTLPRAQMTAR